MKAVPIGRVAELIKELGDGAKVALRKGSVRAAERARARLVEASPVDQGQLRKSWLNAQPADPASLALVHNHAPHASVIENGADPHPVSREGILSIYAWAMRHRMGNGKITASGANAGLDTGALGVAYAIANKIAREGQEPTYFVRNLLPVLTDEAHRLVAQVLHEALRNKGAK